MLRSVVLVFAVWVCGKIAVLMTDLTHRNLTSAGAVVVGLAVAMILFAMAVKIGLRTSKAQTYHHQTVTIKANLTADELPDEIHKLNDSGVFVSGEQVRCDGGKFTIVIVEEVDSEEADR